MACPVQRLPERERRRQTTLIGATAGLVRTPTGYVFVFGHNAVGDLEARLLVGVAWQEVHCTAF